MANQGHSQGHTQQFFNMFKILYPHFLNKMTIKTKKTQNEAITIKDRGDIKEIIYKVKYFRCEEINEFLRETSCTNIT